MCVSVPDIRRNVIQAALFCNRQNGRLVHIDSEEKTQFIESFLRMYLSQLSEKDY